MRNQGGRQASTDVMERTVVVLLYPEIKKSRLPEPTYAVRYRQLGLTGYGATADEAERSAKELYRVFIQGLRHRGDLEKQLDRSRVEWYWEDEYPAHRGPVVQYLEPHHDWELISPEMQAMAA